MNKFVFANGKELEALRVEEGPTYYDNANRRMLTVEVATENGLDAVNELLSDEANLVQVKHVNDAVLVGADDKGNELFTTAEDIFDYYQLKMSLSLKPVSIGEDETGQVKTEERIVFELGRLTPIEIKLAQLGIR